jgi:membrane protein implicated in regulation of membrane protease activity
VLINRNFARLWAAQATSGLGDYVFETTLLLWIASVLLAGSASAPAAVSGVVIAYALATMVSFGVAALLFLAGGVYSAIALRPSARPASERPGMLDGVSPTR